jgi:hypothetical protein
MLFHGKLSPSETMDKIQSLGGKIEQKQERDRMVYLINPHNCGLHVQGMVDFLTRYCGTKTENYLRVRYVA